MKITWQDVVIFIVLIFILSLPLFVNNQIYENNRKENSFVFLENTTQGKLFYPLINAPVNYLAPASDASFSVLVNPENDEEDRILFRNNYQNSLPMASITKLMTAVVALDNYDLEDYVTINPNDLSVGGALGVLKAGDTIKVKDLLYILLIESNNGAAEALAEKSGRYSFIKMMNEKAAKLKMSGTSYFNPTGLDIDGSDSINRTSPDDLRKLTVEIMNKYPLIPEILKNVDYTVYGKQGQTYALENTNILLSEDENVVWGKTGLTDKAKGCLIFITKPKQFSFSEKRYIINVIIGAENRFEEARRIKSWLDKQFIW